jgi:hypothetical protein
VKILLVQRAEYNTDDELIYSNHDGYVFYHSRGFEAGNGSALKKIQEFVCDKTQERRLKDRLHAIWFVLFEYLSLLSHKVCLSGIAFQWTILSHH